jgi:CRISPR-associated protein Csb2
MATTVAFRFPLGRYHATPWDRSVNEGAVEWPPSPWRLLRALVATWYTRWPDLPAPVLDDLLDGLGDPPAYWTPPTWPAHTRHYLPDLGHKKGETGGTDLTLDPFLSLSRDDELLVRWEVDLGPEQRSALAKLAELLPYVGRADSVCEARLLERDPEPDDTWWRPGTVGSKQIQLLSAARPVRRSVLEQSTVDVRGGRRTIPPGTAWVGYAAPPVLERRSATAHREVCVDAIRLFVTGAAPLMSTRGILLADDVHRQAGHRLAAAGIPDDRRQEILGSKRAVTDHQHAHWLPLGDEDGHSGLVSSLVIWVPGGLHPEEVGAVIGISSASGQRAARGAAESYEIRGFPPVELLLQAVGSVKQVAPELCGPARRWISVTPYLPVRHRKRESLDEFVAADVGAELRYRGLPSATVARCEQGDGLSDPWAREFRRYRIRENLGKARPGLRLRLAFDQEVQGPLLLGQLSHFGYGIFVPANS